MLKFIDVHTHYPSENSDEILSVLNIFSSYLKDREQIETYCSIGLHPWQISNTNYEDELSLIRKFAKDDRVLAIGECGFDKKVPDIELQIRIFSEQAKIAEDVGKPVIIHCVGKWEELLKVKKEINPRQVWIIHGFRGNANLANQLIKQGFFLSFGEKYFLSGNNQTLQNIPLDRIFLETDDGKTRIPELYEMATAFLQLPQSVLKQKLQENFLLVFGSVKT
jgi:TatD DNase family protein